MYRPMSLTNEDKNSAPTPICSIGASAGGVAALQDFFRGIDDDLGIAFVVIVHLAPDQPSHLNDILAACTAMPVTQVKDAVQIKPNHVFVIPPDRELVILGDDIAARPFREPRGRRAPIDMFFRSVAAGRGDGMAVVLSGSGSDGALGVRAVKEAGGVILVQDPNEAEYPTMPRSAIATGAVDFVVPVAALTARIAEVMQSKNTLREISAEEAEREFAQIIKLLHARTGHDFSSYKHATIKRRVARRMQVARQSSLAAYYHYLKGSPEEASELFSDLLISVTNFFRDHEAFSTLSTSVIAPLIDKAGGDGSLRIWVVGCATGEEAYSIGMLLLEEADRRGVRPAIQIFASDLDEGAIATAREGRYPKAIEADLSEARIRRFFIDEGTDYRVKKELRDLVLFAVHSALKDPPFIKLDLISCRNLLIYLKRDLQAQLCNLFHYALHPHGFLFLGSAETVGDITPVLFNVVNRDARIYAARKVPEHLVPGLPRLAGANRGHKPEPKQPPAMQLAPSLGRAHAAALEELAPPTVLVDSGYRLLHLSPTASRFLLPSEGPFSSELPALVRPELRVDLKLALRRAFESGESSHSPPIPVAFNGNRHLVALYAMPSNGTQGNGINHVLVFFLDSGKAPPAEQLPPDGDINQEEVRRLRRELSAAQDRLSASRSEHEEATQDLRAANEELQSVNEEYRSTGEELETSKEELQSMNEELHTVNAELKAKLAAISSTHNDLRNLMGATEIGTLFLDPELKIKLFTANVAKLFNITNADSGRSISIFRHCLNYDKLESDVTEVLNALIPLEREVQTLEGQWLAMRLRPYRTVEDRIEGVVVTFADVTERKTAEDALADELKSMTRLQQLSTRVIEEGALETLLTAVIETSAALIGAEFGAIHLAYDDTGTLHLAAHIGFEQRYLDHFLEIDASEGSVCGMALASRQPVALSDVESEPAVAGTLMEARVAGFRAVQATPLFTRGGKIVGVLSTYFREPRKFSEHSLFLIAVCARQAADAINAYMLQQSLRESESRLRKVLETDAVGVLFFDDQGTLTGANDAFLKMTGYSRRQVEARELSWRSMTPPEWVAASEAQMENLDQTGRVGPYEKEYLRQDGSRRWMLFAGRRIEKDLIAEYCIDISDRKRAEKEKELLSQELSHRVKNTLAVFQALVLQTGGETVEAFREALTGRLSNLAQIHSLLLQSDWRSADLGDVVRNALAPFGHQHEEGVSVEGAKVELSPKQASGISLILHELATNAAKYGSLSNAKGQVRISWRLHETVNPGRRVTLLWQEREGPKITPPQHKGFGTRLIERACEYELDGQAELRFERKGLTCRIVFPIGAEV
jgi:two-component system, chemotaxis family, CheB/CheR fusion protein